MEFFRCLLLTAAVLCSSAEAFPTWSKTYSHGQVRFVVPESSGDITFATQSGEAHLVHLDQDGNEIWSLEFPGIPRGLALHPSGGYAVLYDNLGVTRLRRVGADGQLLNDVEAPVDYYGRNLAATDDGCLVYAGYDTLVKVDEDFNMVWAVSTADSLLSLQMVNRAPSESGGVCVGGYGINSWGDIGIIAGIADSCGTILWTGLGLDLDPWGCLFIDACAGADGRCYGAGYFSSSFPPPISRESVFRFNEPGNVDWKITVYDVKRLCESLDGFLIAAGVADPLGDLDVFIKKINPDTSNPVWTRTHGYPGVTDQCNCIAVCQDGGFVIGGTSGSQSLILRVDSQGFIDGTGITGPDTQEPSISVSPSPASASAAVTVSVPDGGRVAVSILDLAGRQVITLADGYFTPGSHMVIWNLTDQNGEMVPDGVFFLKVDSGSQTETRKITVIR